MGTHFFTQITLPPLLVPVTPPPPLLVPHSPHTTVQTCPPSSPRLPVASAPSPLSSGSSAPILARRRRASLCSRPPFALRRCSTPRCLPLSGACPSFCRASPRRGRR